MNSILITGSNRGLGLGLVKQLLAASKPTKHIFATCRNPDNAQVTLIFLFHFFFIYFIEINYFHDIKILLEKINIALEFTTKFHKYTCKANSFQTVFHENYFDPI